MRDIFDDDYDDDFKITLFSLVNRYDIIMTIHARDASNISYESISV